VLRAVHTDTAVMEKLLSTTTRRLELLFCAAFIVGSAPVAYAALKDTSD